MFITSAEMHDAIASAIFPGRHVWHRVQVPLAIPLVISRIAFRFGSKQVPEYNTYISDTGLFAAMAVEPKACIDGADLLLPPQVSGSARWEIQQVLELWECEEPEDSEMHCFIVRTAQGDHSDSVCGTTAADLKKRKRLYRMKSHDTQQRGRRT